MYTLTKVTKEYPKGRGTVKALQGVDLEIPDGEWLAIQGPTGHGKSTLLQILGGLDRATSGTVDFDGRDLTKLGEGAMTTVRAQSIGFIFQTFNLIPTLSAQENVETALVPLGVSNASRRARAAEALASVGLADRARHLPSELSGGEQQRVAIARAPVSYTHLRAHETRHDLVCRLLLEKKKKTKKNNKSYSKNKTKKNTNINKKK